MASCTVNYNLKDAGYANFANQTLTFTLLTAGAEGAGDYIVAASSITSTSDASGNGSVTLFVNDDSGIKSIYDVTLPNAEHIRFIIPTGTTTIELANLIVNNQPVGDTEVQQSTVYAQAIQRANHTGTQLLSTISDAGTIASQNSNAVSITGGSITGITDVAIADGGTGASTASGARTNLSAQQQGDVLDDLNTLGTATSDGEFIVATGAGAFQYESGLTARTSLGLGTIATQNANSVDIDGGAIDGTTIGAGSPVSGSFTNVIADQISFDTTAAAGSYTKGVLRWNDTDKTLEFDNGDDAVTIQVNQEEHVRCQNNSGADIANGSVVRINGSSGGFPTIVKAQADSAANASGTLGIATHTIENGTAGTVTTFGIVRGLDTSSFSAGDAIYLSSSTAGGIVNIAPQVHVSLGYVITSSASDGTIFVKVQPDIPEFGGIYVKNGAVAQALSTAFQKITAFTNDTADSGGISDSANDQLVLTRGTWRVSCMCSVSSDTNTTSFIQALFLDGVELDDIQNESFLKTAGEKITIPISGIVYVDQDTETLDLRVKVGSGTPNVTVAYANLTASSIK